MTSRFLVVACAFLFAAPTLPAVAASASPAFASPELSTDPEPFQVREKTEVPNTTLPPGSYSIRVLDHLHDRVILQVSGKGNKVQTTFLAVPASTMANAPVGPILYSTGPKGKSAIKGFSFPGGLAVEFVYPKTDAVSIATANGTRVMAIDPASEGKVPAPKLSPNDMQMITLWMLEPVRVGPSDAKPTISASRYQAPQPAIPAPAPVQTAQAQPEPAAPVASTETAAAAPAPTPTPAPRPAPESARRHAPVQLAQNDAPPSPARPHTRPANVKVLPHTASSLPLLWLGAFGSLLAGSTLSLRRYRVRS